MTYEPSSLLEIAQTLYEYGEGEDSFEPYVRSVCNRSYYAAYGTIRKALEQIDSGLFRESGRHMELVVVLGDQGPDEHLRRIGSRLNSLKKHREDSDYRFAAAVTKDDAKSSLSLSKTILGKIESVNRAQWQKVAKDLARFKMRK